MISRCRWMFLLLAFLIPAGPAPAQVVEQLQPDILRIYPSQEIKDTTLPSFALQSLVEGTPFQDDLPVPIRFIQHQGRPAVFIPIEEGTDLYGTGEVFGPLRRNGTRTVCWNTDSYAYGSRNLSLYQSHPWVLAVRKDGSSFGVLADTTHRCLIDLTTGILFAAEGPEFPVIVVSARTPALVMSGLHWLIGSIPLPPRWALGYHQCRYSYTPDDRVLEIARTFREKMIPCDVIWWDIDYMDGFRKLTFHPTDFPDPGATTDALRALDFRTIAIIDPGIKQEPGYAVYDTGQAIDAWILDRNGHPFVGRVWPGDCVFPDFTRARVRGWWGELYQPWLELSGIDGVWNDMNEPAVFHSEGWTMPSDNLHQADLDMGGPAPHTRYHNVYGMLMARATFEGVQKARPDKRPFVLTRANYIGGQRYAATWTGDNVSSWEHLDASIAMVLNLSLSGQPFCGPDIGGFCEAGDGKMFARWMGFGALFPFARGHTGKGNIDKEPWSFGPEVEATCRRALEGRYRLIPYLYTCFRIAMEWGFPVWQPLFFADPHDPGLRDIDDIWLIGSDLMVSANTSPGGNEAPDPPRMKNARWAEITEFVYGSRDDPDLPRLFLREGAALPLGPVTQSTAYPITQLTVLAYPGEDMGSHGTWYDDEGEGIGYRTGDFGTWELLVQDNELKMRRASGNRPFTGQTELVIVGSR